MREKILYVLVAMAMLAGFLPSPVPVQAGPPKTVTVTGGMAAGGIGQQEKFNAALSGQLANIVQEKQTRTPAQRKIDSRVLKAVGEARNRAAVLIQGQTSKFSDLSTPLLKIDDPGNIEVKLTLTSTGSAQLQQLAALGLKVRVALPDYNIIEGTVSYQQVEAIAGLDFVKNVTTPGYPWYNTGSVTSEGDAATRAAEARSSFSVNGSGIKVGVMSDGVSHLANVVATGDLPSSPAVQVLSAGSGDEGTAMLEIVNDLAPGAPLAFYAPASSTDMVTGIRALSDAGAKVIVDDITFLDEPKFEDGPIAQEARNFAGVYVTSAGNSAQTHYGHVYVPTPSSPAAGYAHAHEYNPGGASDIGNTFLLGNGRGITTILQWNNQWGYSNDDFDLFLIRSSDNVTLAVGDTIQDGNDAPFEGISYTNTSGADVNVYIAVFEYSLTSYPTSLVLDYNVYGGPALEYNEPANSVVGHQAVSEVLSTATSNADTPDIIAPYSSRGPGRVYFPTLADRQTPNITGIDGVSNKAGQLLYFYSPFYGTSAAAPHLAAIAALVWQAKPTLTSSGVRNAILNTALDRGTPGWDTTWGFGRVDAYQAVASTLPVAPSVTTGNATNIVSNSATVSGNLTSLGSAASANVSFQYGTTSGNLTIETEMVAMNLVGSFSANLTGLSPNTTYYFRAKAVGDGTSYGAEKSFTTTAILGPIITTVAGNGTAAFGGDGGPATSAELYPFDVAVDTSGNLYIADQNNHRIRKVAAASGNITTVAGNGTQGFSGDGGPAISATLNNPVGVTFDNAGNLYIADLSNHRIRKVNTSGIITTVAGNGTQGFSGDSGPATSASLKFPYGVAFDAAGNFYIPDSQNHRIRKVDTSGIITTVAGTGTAGFSGDGTPAINAKINYPYGVAVDGEGNLYIADSGNNRIRKRDIYGIMSTVSGNGTAGFSGDGGPATAAQLNSPYGVACDGAGNFYIADPNNHRIRKVNASGIISTVAGNGTAGYGGDGGPATGASLNLPLNVAIGGVDNLFIADFMNYRIRKVEEIVPPSSVPPTVITDNAINITSATARLNGTLVSLGTATSANVSFQYGTTSGNYTIETEMLAMNLVGGFSANITGLSANTTYYFRAKAAGNGTNYGAEISFTTLAEPSLPPHAITVDGQTGDWAGIPPVVTDPSLDNGGAPGDIVAAYVTRDSANLYMRIDTASNIGPLVPIFMHIDTDRNAGTGYNSNTDTMGIFVSKNHNLGIDFSIGINANLGPNTAYLYDWRSLPPTPVSANLSFAYNTLPGNVLELSMPLSALESYPLPWNVVFRTATPPPAAPTNDDAPDTGFVTYSAEMPPTVTTDNATSITSTSARLNGTLVSLGAATSANVSFQYGTTSGNYTIETEMLAMNLVGGFSANITGLSANTTYYFRAVASAHGTANGTERSFRTANAAIVSDDFNDNTTDHALWSAYQGGSGPTVVETNQRLEINLPASSAQAGGQDWFGAGYGSVFRLRGDFDIQIDYDLLVWPTGNGVRVALQTDVGQPARASFGNPTTDFPEQPREVYFTDFFLEGPQGIVATNNLSGKLRMVRLGGTATGYYFSSGNWVPIRTGPCATNDVHLRLAAWSHDNIFTDRDVKVAFDNFVVNQGQLVSPPNLITDNATNITSNSATLNGTLFSLGGAVSANVSFQYGTSSGNLTIETEMVAMNLVGGFSANLTGLSPNTTYYFRTKAVGDGVSYGVEKSFATTLAGVNVIRNGDFSSGLANWIINPKLPSTWDPLWSGGVSLHPTGMYEFNGVVLYQNLNVTGIGGKTFNLSMKLSTPYTPPPGKTVAVYINYVDTANNTQIQKVLNPNNADITQNTIVSANYTFPGNARKLVKISLAKENYGEFIADDIMLTSTEITAGPVPVISTVTPGAGNYGTTVTINGTDFGPPAGVVTIGGSPAGVTVNSWSNTSITVTVSEPARSGPVGVIADFVESNIDKIFEVTSPNFTLHIPKDYIAVVKGQPANIPIGVGFHHGFTTGGGINFQASSGNISLDTVFTPIPLRNPGGVVLKINTSGLAAGTYPIMVSTIEGSSLPRTAKFMLKVVTTSDIKFYEYDASYIKNYLTSKNVSQQGSLAIYTEGTDSDGNPLTAPINLQSGNPNILGVYPGTYSVSIYALQAGSANLMASAPDGFSANLTVNITVPADPAITSISLTPAQVTNKYADNLTFWATGTRPIGWEILGMLSNNLKDSTMDWSGDLKTYGGNFKINDADPPGLGTYLFGAVIYASDQSTKLAEAVQPLTIVNDPTYSAIKGGVIVVDPSVQGQQTEMFNLEFYQGGTLQFTRQVFQNPHQGAGGFELGAIPPGTYKIKFVPFYNLIRSQWYPNADNMSAAGNVVLNAGQVTHDIFFFPKAAPNLVSIAVTPANASVGVGGTQQFYAIGTFDDNSSDNVSNAYWSSNNTNVANISYTGLATGYAPGLAGITASMGPISGTAVLTVTPVSLTVATDNATDITSTSARLNGTLVNLGAASSANVSFQYGTTSGNLTIETEMLAMNLTGSFSANITGLSANTSYYFRAKAVGDWPSGLPSFGSEKSFTTLPSPPPPPSTIYISPAGNDVTGDGSLANPFATIQKGVDTASAGATIIVRNGTYTQNVNVNKSLNIHSENGPEMTTVVAANTTDHVFEVTAGNTVIRGFTVYGTGITSYKAGIELHQVTNVIIENNYSGTGSSTDNYYGVLIYRGANNQILNNRFIDDSEGIYLQGSDNNTIADNFFRYSEYRDIHLDYAPYPNGSDNNIIRGNTASDGASTGIYLNLSNSNQIMENQISNKVGSSGIELYNSQSNTIKGNNVSQMQGLYSAGIKIGMTGYPSNANTIYLNNLNNNDTDVSSEASTNVWQSPSPLNYIYQNHSYTSYLGNYYGHYTGVDNGAGGRIAGDGIGDTSIPVTTDGAGDNYPLMATTNNYLQGIIYTLTLAVNPAEGGFTIPAIGNYAFLSDTSVNITAVPSAGWHFVNWAGSVTDPGSANTTVVMTGNKTATANFATSGTLPTVTTDNATNITGNSARLNGTLTSLGTATSANVSFQYGTSSGNYTIETEMVQMNLVGTFSANLTGLSANITYYFRAKVVGDWPSGLPSYGQEKNFTTPAGTIVPGDANGDGTVNALDITTVERIIAHMDPPTPGADANQDGFIDALDITKVERIIVRLD